MRSNAFKLIILMSCFVSAWGGTLCTVNADDESSITQQDEFSTVVNYEETMLVVTTDEGVVAIRFDNPGLMGDPDEFARFLVTYRWRFTNGSDPETTGKGELYAGIQAGEVKLRSKEIQAGPLRLRWSYVDSEFGRIDYVPSELQIQQIKNDWFEEYSNPARLGFRAEPRPAIELERFLDRHQVRMIRGKREPSRLHTKLHYQQHAIVVESAEGIALFVCDEHIDLKKGNEHRYGSTYRYAVLHTGEQEWSSGTDEVWELYLDGRYTNDQSKLDFVAGQVELNWSRGGEAGGWIYFTPEKARVSLISHQYGKLLIEDPQSLQKFRRGSDVSE